MENLQLRGLKNLETRATKLKCCQEKSLITNKLYVSTEPGHLLQTLVLRTTRAVHSVEKSRQMTELKLLLCVISAKPKRDENLSKYLSKQTVVVTSEAVQMLRGSGQY